MPNLIIFGEIGFGSQNWILRSIFWTSWTFWTQWTLPVRGLVFLFTSSTRSTTYPVCAQESGPLAESRVRPSPARHRWIRRAWPKPAISGRSRPSVPCVDPRFSCASGACAARRRLRWRHGGDRRPDCRIRRDRGGDRRELGGSQRGRIGRI